MNNVIKYVDEWKANELERYNELFKEYCEKYNELYKEYVQALDAQQHGSYSHGVKTSSADELDRKYKETWDKVKNYRLAHQYFAMIFDRIMWFNRNHRDELDIAYKEAEEKFKKEIDAHFRTLQAKVEKKIGTIEKIALFGGDNYMFEGSLGSCNVEVILAGGYNIQRLHTRWIITNVRNK